MRHKIILITSVSLALFTGACATRQGRPVHGLGTIEAAPAQAEKGYVEFITVNESLPIPIFQLDGREVPFALAGIGLKEGDRYSYARYEMPIVENLRVSEAPGTYIFMIDMHGQPIEVPVEPGRITPVEINSVVLDSGDFFKTYWLDYRILKPVPYQKDRLRAPQNQEKTAG